MATRWSIRILVIAMFVAITFADTEACTCAFGDGPACQEAWRQSVDAILLGRVEKIEAVQGTMGAPAGAMSMTLMGRANRVTIAVEESYRGTSEKTAQVYTAASEAACGFSFQEGERYLVFAAKANGQLVVSLCSATRPAKYAAEDIDYLRSLPSLPTTARAYGTLKRYTYDPDFKPKFEPSIMDHYRPPEEEYRAMAAMPGTVVRVKTADGSHEATVDEQGDWEIRSLPAGSYEIAVDLPKNMILDTDFGIRGQLAAKGCSRVDLRAESNGHIQGRVSSDPPLSKYYLAQIAVLRAEDAEADLVRPPFEIFPDSSDGTFDLGPLPPGKYYLVAILNNHDLDVAAVFDPGVENPQKATIIQLGDGETRSNLDFSIGPPRFHSRSTCCEYKISLHMP
jgi:hypothetical protein